MNQRSFGALLVFLSSGCVNEMSTSDGGGTPDSGMDSATGDAGIDVIQEAAPDVVGTDAGPTYNDIVDTSKWETFDMSGLTNNDAHYIGGTFDGRYVYYSPTDSTNGRSGLLTRYDTMGTFTQASSWEKFDLTTKNAGLKGFSGAVFDGAYVYLTPYAGTPGLFVRYKTNQPFASANSYETSDLIGLVGANAKAMSTGIFDGKYVYITPCFFGLAARVDIAASFTAGASYSAATIANGKTCYLGSNFDGKYVYYVEQVDTGSGLTGGNIVRYDVAKPMTGDASAYLSFDTQANVDMAARGYYGSVFDGRYLYLIPADGSGTSGTGMASLVVRYDTQAQFDQKTSWTSFDLSAVSSGAHGYNGGTFDGRYVYFAPRKTSLAIRYDTQKAFGSTTAWQVLDLGSIDVSLKSFYGAVFDGRHVYFVPYAGPKAVRFDAKTPPSLPPQASSFY